MMRLLLGAIAAAFVVGLFWPQLLPFESLDPYLWVLEMPAVQAVFKVLPQITFFGLAAWAVLKGTRDPYLPRKLIFFSVGFAWVLMQAIEMLPRLQPRTAIVYYHPAAMALGWIFTIAVILAFLIDALENRRKRLSV